jgi:mannose-1-phosphate guanylyltransferase
LFRTPNPSSCGIVEVDASGWVLEFLEKPAQPRGDLANGAIYIGTSSLRDHLGGPDFSRDVLAKLGGRLLGYEHRGVLVDIGTLEQYERWKDRSLP